VLRQLIADGIEWRSADEFARKRKKLGKAQGERAAEIRRTLPGLSTGLDVRHR
jgi:hypothetical protein